MKIAQGSCSTSESATVIVHSTAFPWGNASISVEPPQISNFKLFMETNNSFWLEMSSFCHEHYRWPKVKQENKTKYRLEISKILIIVVISQESGELLLSAQILINNKSLCNKLA